MPLRMKSGVMLKRALARMLIPRRGNVVVPELLEAEAGRPRLLSLLPPAPTDWNILGPAELADEMRQQMGEENWARVTAVPPAPAETG